MEKTFIPRVLVANIISYVAGIILGGQVPIALLAEAGKEVDVTPRRAMEVERKAARVANYVGITSRAVGVVIHGHGVLERRVESVSVECRIFESSSLHAHLIFAHEAAAVSDHVGVAAAAVAKVVAVFGAERPEHLVFDR